MLCQSRCEICNLGLHCHTGVSDGSSLWNFSPRNSGHSSISWHTNSLRIPLSSFSTRSDSIWMQQQSKCVVVHRSTEKNHNLKQYQTIQNWQLHTLQRWPFHTNGLVEFSRHHQEDPQVQQNVSVHTTNNSLIDLDTLTGLDEITMNPLHDNIMYYIAGCYIGSHQERTMHRVHKGTFGRHAG